MRWGAEPFTDRPTLWDGVPIEWGPWSEINTSLRFHLPEDEFACSECGAIDEGNTAGGRRGGLLNLTIDRCRHCRHDRVHDHLTGEYWDLEPKDYGLAGSQRPTEENRP